MNNKIKIISINPLKIEVIQPCKKGEIIDLSQYLNDPSNELQNYLNQYIKKIYNQEIDNIKINEQNKFNLLLKNTLLEKTEEYKQKIQKLINEKDNIKKITELEKNQEFAKQIQELQDKNNNLINEKNNEIKLKIKEIELQFQNEINQLNIDKNNLNNNINNLKRESEQNLKNKENELLEKFNRELLKKDEEIKELKHQKNVLGTKALGNDLENYCQNEIQTKLIDYVGDDSIIMNKITKHKEHSMADFKVEFKNISLLNNNVDEIETFKVVLEMKAEALNTQENNKKSNDSYIKELVKDAKNEKADVAILVTELEKDDTFLFRKINNKDYQTNIEIYMIRPSMLIYLLSLLRLIYLKYVAINQIKDIVFKDKQKILEDFNNFKNDLLTHPIKYMEDKLNNIIKQANIIKKSSFEIEELANEIIETNIKSFKKKIEDFNIENKIIKKINKIEDNNVYSKELNKCVK